MSDDRFSAGSEEEPAEAERPIIRDKRRLDPQTGQVRNPETAEGSSPVTDDQSTNQGVPDETQAAGGDNAFAGAVGDDLPGEDQEQPAADVPTSAADAPGATEPRQTDADIAAGLQDELLRERAAYHNYRELMKRERPKDREQAIGSVVESLLPVLDDIYLAHQHGDLEGSPFEKIAGKLETTLGRFGVQRFGEVGEPFDPQHHEALMHIEAEVPEGSDGTTVVQVMQPGYRVGERIVRPARVAVADPQ
ncbi:nucleotide exchange factor GrpE [Luteipulveratus flavus]|uniref:Protein GrpE n=1 Tax=Luteipulveratus flavus TaxID=3031728 RepID=A0ABT6C9Y5_9MICO|nr:nucleotide exchange factor GrpE [Luteipulveratus sp. YIM 133296]MDF8265711.1 nucleotide exchange factor GrpE [Luteipulveratus sp. YIM 133296]